MDKYSREREQKTLKAMVIALADYNILTMSENSDLQRRIKIMVN